MKSPVPKSFNNLVEFLDYFTNEEICLKYLSLLKWNKSPVCPHCKNVKVYEYKDGKLYKCAKCRRQFSVKAGTIFEGSKIPLKKWFNAIFLITSNIDGTSSIQLSRDICVTQKTAWFMLHKIRQALQIKSYSNKTVVLKKRTQEPMMKWIHKSFDDVMKRLTTRNITALQRLNRKPENKRTVKEKPVYQRPSMDFDPETD